MIDTIGCCAAVAGDECVWPDDVHAPLRPDNDGIVGLERAWIESQRRLARRGVVAQDGKLGDAQHRRARGARHHAQSLAYPKHIALHQFTQCQCFHEKIVVFAPWYKGKNVKEKNVKKMAHQFVPYVMENNMPLSRCSQCGCDQSQGSEPCPRVVTTAPRNEYCGKGLLPRRDEPWIIAPAPATGWSGGCAIS